MFSASTSEDDISSYAKKESELEREWILVLQAWNDVYGTLEIPHTEFFLGKTQEK